MASEFGIDDCVDELEATTEAFREQLRDCQETLERRDQSSNPEMDEAGADDGDSIWNRARRFIGDDN